MSIDVSIIICTYNRAESLKDTLNSINQLDIDAYQVELLVVDNNSSDNTKDIVLNFSQQSKFPTRYLFESQQGLSYARNRGIKKSQGQIILFTDDDVLPASSWLIKMKRSMDSYHCLACGGYIAPIWEGDKPKWLTERFYGYLAVKTETRGPFRIEKNEELPFGANMGFRREAFDKYGLFDTNRGRKGSNLASGEDGEFFQRMIDAGEHIYYFPDSHVQHKVESFRLKKNYFRRWRYQSSKNIAQAVGIQGDRLLFGIPLYMYPQLFRSVVKAIKSKLLDTPDEALHREMLVCHFLGTMSGLYQKEFHGTPRKE